MIGRASGNKIIAQFHIILSFMFSKYNITYFVKILRSYSRCKFISKLATVPIKWERREMLVGNSS